MRDAAACCRERKADRRRTDEANRAATMRCCFWDVMNAYEFFFDFGRTDSVGVWMPKLGGPNTSRRGGTEPAADVGDSRGNPRDRKSAANAYEDQTVARMETEFRCGHRIAGRRHGYHAKDRRRSLGIGVWMAWCTDLHPPRDEVTKVVRHWWTGDPGPTLGFWGSWDCAIRHYWRCISRHRVSRTMDGLQCQTYGTWSL